MMHGMSGRIARLTLHLPGGDVEIDTSKIRAIPGMWATTMPGSPIPAVQQFWRFAPVEPGAPEMWYGGPWSVEWVESSIAIPNMNGAG